MPEMGLLSNRLFSILWDSHLKFSDLTISATSCLSVTPLAWQMLRFSSRVGALSVS